MSAPFPMFVELAGRKCLVVGGSAVAEAKVQSLLAADASVKVVASHGTPLLEKLERAGKICWERREFQPKDLAGAEFVLAATSLTRTNQAVMQEAKKQGVLSSVAEPPNYCDFYLLLEWLPQVQDAYIKETIVRALAVPSAKPFAAPALIEEFRNASPAHTLLKQAIAQALAVVADDSVCADIIELARDVRHGKARQMIVLALGNMTDPRATEAAMRLLNDEVVAGHAIMALGALKAQCSKNSLKPFLSHRRAWIRREAQKAVQRIDAHSTASGAFARGKRTLPQMARSLFKLKKRA